MTTIAWAEGSCVSAQRCGVVQSSVCILGACVHLERGARYLRQLDASRHRVLRSAVEIVDVEEANEPRQQASERELDRFGLVLRAGP